MWQKVSLLQKHAKILENMGKRKPSAKKVLNDDDGSLGRDKDVLSLLLPSYCANKHPKLNCCQGQNNQIFSSYILSNIAKKLLLPYFSSSTAILSEWQERELEFWTVIFDTLETLKRKQERKEEGVGVKLKHDSMPDLR